MGTEMQLHYTMDDLERMALAIAKSGLFGIKSTEQAMALMLICQAEGLHPATAARDYHIIQGRPALKADAILARFQQAGGRVEWLEYSDQKVVGRFSHPQGGEVIVDWTLERAKAAGLGGKDIWRSYPRQMLRARVISEGVRTVYPAVLSGFYTPEEVIDMEPAPTPRQPASAAPAFEAPEKPKTDSGKPDKEIFALARAFRSQGFGERDRELILSICSNIVGREISSSRELGPEEAVQILEVIEAVADAQGIESTRDFWAAYLAKSHEGDLGDIPSLIKKYKAPA